MPPLDTPKARLLLPREHGAYAQLLLPLVAAQAVGHPSVGSVSLSVAASLLFVAHESLLTLLGHRGPRALRERTHAARTTLFIIAPAAAALLVPAVAQLAGDLDLLFVPLALCGVVLVLAYRKEERSTAGEMGAAVALTSWALPVGRLAGASRVVAFELIAAFSAAFILATLAVRALIAHHKRRADAKWLRLATCVLAGLVPLAIVTQRCGTIAGALLPMAALAATLAISHPHPRYLFKIGFGTMGASIVVAGILIATLRA